MKRDHIQTLLCRVGLFVLAGLLLASCAKDNLTNTLPLPVEPGIPVKISLEIKIPTVTSPAAASSGEKHPVFMGSNALAGSVASATTSPSKGLSVSLLPGGLSAAGIDTAAVTRASGTRKLFNLWVFQFAADGAKRKVTKMPNTPEPIEERVLIDVELITGTDQTIYLVALGSEYSSVDLSAIGSKDDLEAYTLPSIKSDAQGNSIPVITADEQMPYCGSIEGLAIAEDANGRGYLRYPDNIPFTGGISMTAMLARVDLDFAFQVAEAEEGSMTLNKFPREFPIKPSSSYKPTSFVNMGIKLDASTPKTPDGRYQFTWYIAPNPQGKVASITSQEQRVRANNYFDKTNPGKIIGDAPEDGSHIVIWAKHKVENRYVLYYLFLGGNLTDDFNVLPGSAYTMRTDINAIDTPDDLRIISTPMYQTLYFRASERKGSPDANWLKINSDNNFGNPEYDLDVHPSMRPIEVFVLSGDVKISIDYYSVGWLHLSAYPNYTAAKQAQMAGKPDGLTNRISVRAKIPTQYKFYVYCDEYPNYYHNDVTGFKRTATLTFDIATIDGTGTRSVTAKIAQRPGFLVGRVGGNFDDKTGRYAEYLAYEAIGEYDDGDHSTTNYPCDYLPYYPKQVWLSRGFYTGIDWEAAKSNYDVGNFYNGKKATRLMAEGRGGGELDPKNIVKPTWTDGKLDLYQFDYTALSAPSAKTGYGFIARACFDRNRDDNGNGVIDPDEYHWYMPSFAQHHIGVTFNFRAAYTSNVFNIYDKATAKGDVYTSTQYDPKAWLQLSTGNLSAASSAYYPFPRCVRDLPVSTSNASSSPEQPKIEIKNDGGADYAAIDATGLKVNPRPNFGTIYTYTNISHDDKTASGTNNGKYIYTDKTAGIRTIRHQASTLGFLDHDKYATFVVSSRFMVASEHLPVKYTWAVASGWNNAANNNLAGITTEATGCAAYKGKNGTDAEGTWRVPNICELVLISIYDGALKTTEGTTGYKTLITDLTRVDYLWSSSEIVAGTAVGYQPMVAEGTIQTPRVEVISKTKSHYVRCIKDY